MKNTRYQINVTLKNIRPPIWRRLLIPANCTMDALHCAMQTAMGWQDGHLYAFHNRERWIEIPDPDNMWDGSWGYQHVLELLGTPEQKLDIDGKEKLEWIGGAWDAEAFDLNDINDALAGWKPNQSSFMYEGICG